MLSKRFRRTLMATLVAPALAVPAAVLAEGTMRQSQQQQSQVQLQRHDLRASQMTGMDVRNPQGEALGEVKDIVIDARTGEVAYIALAHGGMLGLGEELHAYPVKAFRMGEDRDELVLNVSEEQLENTEGFNDDNWPKIRNDRDYWSGIDLRFGVNEEVASAGGSAERTERSFVRGSELIDRSVVDRNGNEIGQIEDLVISLSEGETRFAVIDTAGDDTLVPIEMDALSVRSDGDEPQVRFEKDRMDLSRAFNKDEWPEALRSGVGAGS